MTDKPYGVLKCAEKQIICYNKNKVDSSTLPLHASYICILILIIAKE
jgi:hypothetical protein